MFIIFCYIFPLNLLQNSNTNMILQKSERCTRVVKNPGEAWRPRLVHKTQRKKKKEKKTPKSARKGKTKNIYIILMLFIIFINFCFFNQSLTFFSIANKCPHGSLTCMLQICRNFYCSYLCRDGYVGVMLCYHCMQPCMCINFCRPVPFLLIDVY